MPKSRRGKGKRYHYSKKSKALRQQEMPGTEATISPAAAGMPETPSPVAPGAPPPVTKAAAPKAKITANSYPYISSELRRIAILVGIIVLVFVVLSIVLS